MLQQLSRNQMKLPVIKIFSRKLKWLLYLNAAILTMYPIQEYKYYETESYLTKFSKALVRIFVRGGRDFCLETSIHGFNHIAVPRRHWVERLLWALTTAAAIWGATNLSLDQWQRYQDSPTVITLEKDFRRWLFCLPAVTYCENNRVDPVKLPQAISSRWGVNPGDEKYSYYERFVSTVSNYDFFHLEGYEEFKDDPELDVDLYKLVFEVMQPLLVKTTWSIPHVVVRWFPVITEAGACYATNSLALADVAFEKPNSNNTKMFPITCQYSALSCYVIMEIETKGTFYVHSPYDVMDITSGGSSVFPSMNRITELTVMETGCGKGVRDLSPQRRGCLFTDEAKGGRTVYSTNSCRLSCRSKLAVKLCGCKPFYFIYEEGPVCNPAGMHCLSQYAHQLVTNGGLKCSCSPQCLEATFREIGVNEEIWAKGPLATRAAVRFTVKPPRTRYTREIVFYFQDLVVSFGGAAGLFLGASFISFVEIFYFLMERMMRPCATYKGPDAAKVTKVKVKKQPTTSYEAERIKELNTILENERKYLSLRF